MSSVASWAWMIEIRLERIARLRAERKGSMFHPASVRQSKHTGSFASGAPACTVLCLCYAEMRDTWHRRPAAQPRVRARSLAGRAGLQAYEEGMA